MRFVKLVIRNNVYDWSELNEGRRASENFKIRLTTSC